MADTVLNTYTDEKICEDCLMASEGYDHSSDEHREAVEHNLEGLGSLVYSLDGHDTDEGPQSHFGHGCFMCGDFTPWGNRFNMTVTEFSKEW